MTAAATRPEARPAVRLTGHPLQRAGVWGLTLLAGRDDPDEVRGHDLDAVVAWIAEHAATAGAAPSNGPGYGWWKVLFALYPNSEATHARRPRDRVALEPAIAGLFAPNSDDQGDYPCTFCDSATSAVWIKKNLPMFDTSKALNTLPPGVPGWPVCRACRVAAWALPYAAAVTAGSATVVTCPDPRVEYLFARQNHERALRIINARMPDVPSAASPEAMLLDVLRDPRLALMAGASLWTFKNDNQEPWLRVAEARAATPRFLRAVSAAPGARRGWMRLERALTVRGSGGEVTRSGRDRMARALLDEPGQRAPRLLRLIFDLFISGTKPHDPALPGLRELAALAFLYATEMLTMDPRTLRPVAELIAAWIASHTSPRGRFGEYSRVAGNPYELGKLLMQAEVRLMLDGKPAPMRAADAQQVLGSARGGWEKRMLLFFTVVDVLGEKYPDAGIGGADTDGEEPEPGEEVPEETSRSFDESTQQEEEHA